MNKTTLSIFFLSFIYSFDCFSLWHENFFDSQKNIYLISGLIDKKNNFTLYINNDQNNPKYKIDLTDRVIFGDKKKVLNYSKFTNELFIENSDSLFNKFIFSLLDLNQINKSIKKKGPTKYLFKKFTLGKAQIFLNKSCQSIDSLIFVKHKNKMIIDKINISFINNDNIDSLFNIEINKKDVIKYDFR